MGRKSKHHMRAWTFARAVMRHDTGDVGRHALLARGWSAGYAAALRDVHRVRLRAVHESYSKSSYSESLESGLNKLLEPKR